MGGDGIAQLAIGQWRDHLSYRQGISITQTNDGLIYYASESGACILHAHDNSLERISKINRFSDVGISAIEYDPVNNLVLLAYKNANIDIIQDKIYNISDIKRAVITAKKTIHNIYFKGQYAYLACGFGIVVIDLHKKEIKETYYIGTNGGYINVRDITSDASYIYAATDSGVYRALWSSPNLADFNSWKKTTGLPAGIYNTITFMNGKIYTNLSMNIKVGALKQDTIFATDGNSPWYKPIPDSVYNNGPVIRIESFHNRLVLTLYDNIKFFDENAIYTDTIINGFVTGYSAFLPKQAIIDRHAPQATWIADQENGIVKNWAMWGGTNRFFPNGPNTSDAYALFIEGEELWVARGDVSPIWIGTYKTAEAYRFANETWISFTRKEIPALDSMRDVVAIAIDPSNTQHVYLSTLGKGILELMNGSLVNIWDDKNSSLGSNPNYYWVGCFGMAFDKNGNLWVTNAYANNALSVRKADGSWQSFNLNSVLPANPTVGQIIIDQNNQKWIVLPRGGGILVFDENGTWNTNDDKIKKLISEVGNGNLPSNEVYCLAEDRDGEIWVGTNKGIAVFYCASQVFSSAGCEAQQIYVEQDGHTQILLETEVINAIAVDGANRKWIATQNSGVFLMSEDGTEEVLHFTAENSPLLSNEVRSIAINKKTGEVFFATSLGIISYRNDATEGLDDFTNVYVFPNPVEPGYSGPIAITGLVENADVKITDISGSLVYQTKALGGQAIWYGTNLKGEKAHSGIYLVFCTNEDGTKTYVAKILMVQ